MADFTLEELKAQRKALTQMKRTGVLTLTHGDKTIKHRNMDELQAALNDLNSEIAVLEGRPMRRVRYLSVRKGL